VIEEAVRQALEELSPLGRELIAHGPRRNWRPSSGMRPAGRSDRPRRPDGRTARAPGGTPSTTHSP
jgi:hypothetical protein